MTLDDQLAALRPLTPGAVAALAGYAHADTFGAMRARGSVIPAHRLRFIAERLRGLAKMAEELTSPSQPPA